jgi:hypothetical protein
MMNLVIDAMLRDAPVPVFDLFWKNGAHIGQFVDEAEATMAMWWIAKAVNPDFYDECLFEWINENLELEDRKYGK